MVSQIAQNCNEQPSILIMLASYNGEQYLSKQLDSIIGQDYTNWNLIVQDDGSEDGTLRLLEDYSKKDSRIKYQKNTTNKHGPFYNFHSLANYCKNIEKYDYYMFCDQDDIWDLDKISQFLSIVGKKQADIPVLCYADMRLIDEKDLPKAESVDQIQGIAYVNKYSVFFSHVVSGCNAIMNAACFFMVPLIDLEDPHTAILSHDNLYTKFAAMSGEVLYIPKTLMSYRRHEGNVTSQQAYGNSVTRILQRASHLNDLAKAHATTYNQTLVALDIMRKTIKNPELNRIEKTIRTGGLSALHYCAQRKISWGKPIKNISRKLTMSTGLYKKYLLQDI